MATLGSLLFFIRAKNSEFKQKMDESKRKVKEFDEKLDRSKEKIAKWTTIAKKATIGVAAVGTVAIGAGFKLAKLASDAEETQSRFNHVFSGMEGRANEWANAFADDFGQVTSNVQDWLAGLQDTFVPMGIATEKAYAMSKSITQLSIDMGSFYNKKTEDVIRDIQSAIVGQTETVRKYGVIITEARLKQEAVKQGWIEEGEELTELQKIQARYNLLLEGTTKAQGDYKRTQDSFANQLRETSNLLTEIGQNLGKVVLPSFNKGLELVKGLLERFNGWAESINAVKQRFESLKEVQADNLDTVRDLVNEYEALNEKETLNKEERERLVKISRDLAKLFPDLVIGIDKETGAYINNTEAVLENVRARNLQFMSGNIRKVIKNIKDEIKALENQNEELERLNKNHDPVIESSVNQARMNLIRIMEQAGLTDNIKENMTLEDFYDIQKDSELMQKIKDMGADAHVPWDNAIQTLRIHNDNLNDRSKEIEENKNKAKELNMELEKEKKLLEAIQKTSEGEMSFEELNKFIEELNEEKPAIELELEPPSGEEIDEVFGKTLSDYEKALDEFNHAMAMGGMSLEEQLSTLKEIYDDLTQKQEDLNKGFTTEDKLHMTKDDIVNGLQDLEEKIFSITEQIQKNAIDKAVSNMSTQFSHGKTTIVDYIEFLKNKEKEVLANDKLSYDTRQQYAQQFKDKVLQLEYQRETGIELLNQQLEDKNSLLNEKTLKNELKALDEKKEAVKQSYLEHLGSGEEYNKKAKEVDGVYRRLKLQAEKDYNVQVAKETDRIMQYKYESNEISLQDYKNYLSKRLNDYKQHSQERIAITNKIAALEDELQAKKENQLEYRYEQGEITSNEYIEHLRGQLKEAKELYGEWSNEYIAILSQIDEEEKKASDKKKEHDENYFQWKRSQDEVSHEEYIQHLRNQLQEAKKLHGEWSDEYVAILAQIEREEKSVRHAEMQAELRKQQFLLQQREISYSDYLGFIEKQLAAEKEHTDNWYSLMQERQNTLNTIVQNEMKHYQEKSEEMFKDENERITWLINKLMILKEHYADNNIIVHLLGEEIKKLRDNIADPPAEDSLNWLENMFVAVGYKAEEAQRNFQDFRDGLVDGLTDAITKGEYFLDTLKNIADQIEALIVKRGIVEPFVDWMFTSLFPTGHTGGHITVNGIESFHTGGMAGMKPLRPDERIIKTKVGEIILNQEQQKGIINSQQSTRPEVNVEVINNTGTPIQTRKEVKFDGTRTIVRMFMEGYARNVDGIQDIIKRR